MESMDRIGQQGRKTRDAMVLPVSHRTRAVQTPDWRVAIGLRCLHSRARTQPARQAEKTSAATIRGA